MPLDFFYTMVQKSQKRSKTQIKGVPALKGKFGGKSFHICVRVVVLRDVVKVFPVSSSSFARKTTGRSRARSHSGA